MPSRVVVETRGPSAAIGTVRDGNRSRHLPRAIGCGTVACPRHEEQPWRRKWQFRALSDNPGLGRDHLTDAGLSVVKRYVSGEPDGTVYSQTPSSGKLASGEVVTIDILRAPAAPARSTSARVTKSIGELNKAIAELKASAAELKTSVGELQTSAAELNASVGELKSSAATKDEVGTFGKSIQELRDAVGKAATAAVQAAATRVQAQAKESSADVGRFHGRPPPSHHRRRPQPTKPAEGGES